MNTILFLDGSMVSKFLLQNLLKNKEFNIKKIILSPEFKELYRLNFTKNIPIIKTDFKNDLKKIKLGTYDIAFSYYNFKIPKYVLKKIKIGGINFHPSYLPFNRGRHSTFWGIVKKTPLGASSHWLSSNFDEGDIFYQKKLKGFEKNSAKIIYNQQLKLLKEVITKTIYLISNKKFIKIKQDSKHASYHRSNEIKKFITFNLDRKIDNFKFSRIIRATCFNKKTGFFIKDDKNKYLIYSKFTFKKYSKNKKYKFFLIKKFRNLFDKKKINFVIYLNKSKMLINSIAYVDDYD